MVGCCGTKTRAHPGTAAGRKECFNPQVKPAEFEQRFIATPERLSEAFDFIIVGAGSAGCVLANRLSADPSIKVLLLEAGGEAQKATMVADPRQCTGLNGSEVDWGFRSTPQPQLNNRAIDLERGKMLGGCSSMNYMMWVRGNQEDFNRWSTEFGCGDEWSFSGVLPSYASLESVMHGGPAGGRGERGEIKPTIVKNRLPEQDAFKVAACRKLGLSVNQDYNGLAGQEGVADVQFNTCGRSRADGFTAFVEPVLLRPNLTVASEAFTHRILFADRTRCCGVEVQCSGGQMVQVLARKEVIVCAGAIQSPQLLMLSGVGPAAELRKHKIPVVADVPAVGSHLQDHPFIAIPFRAPKHLASQFPVGSAPAGSMGLNSLAFWKSDEDKKRDVQRGCASGMDAETVSGGRFHPAIAVKLVLNQLEALCPTLRHGRYKNGKMKYGFLHGLAVKLGRAAGGLQATLEDATRSLYCLTIYNHPVSRGSVRLRSADPFAPPLIDLALFRDPSDFAAGIEILTKMRSLMASEPYRKYVGEMDHMPGIHSSALGKGVDAFWKADEKQLGAFIRATSGSTWHMSCTCRMGPQHASPTEAALDPRLRVKGVTGLRVADCSSMPTVCSGNTNATAMMIGDKCARFLLEEYGASRPKVATDLGAHAAASPRLGPAPHVPLGMLNFSGAKPPGFSSGLSDASTASPTSAGSRSPVSASPMHSPRGSPRASPMHSPQGSPRSPKHNRFG